MKKSKNDREIVSRSKAKPVKVKRLRKHLKKLADAGALFFTAADGVPYNRKESQLATQAYRVVNELHNSLHRHFR